MEYIILGFKILLIILDIIGIVICIACLIDTLGGK